MKCQVCSAETASGAAFCQKCGAKLTASGTGAFAGDAVGASTEAQRSADLSSGRGARGPGDVPEETLWEGSYSPKAMLGAFVGAAVLTIVLIVAAVLLSATLLWIAPVAAIGIIWFYVVGKLVAARLGVHYKLTNQMFYHQRGLLTRVTDRIELIEIHDVTYEQNLFDRMVNVGRIKIASNDRTDPIFFVRGIEDVEQVAQRIDKARRGEQVRRGRRIESLGVHEA
jgi:hypothetical protein